MICWRYLGLHFNDYMSWMERTNIWWGYMATRLTHGEDSWRASRNWMNIESSISQWTINNCVKMMMTIDWRMHMNNNESVMYRVVMSMLMLEWTVVSHVFTLIHECDDDDDDDDSAICDMCAWSAWSAWNVQESSDYVNTMHVAVWVVTADLHCDTSRNALHIIITHHVNIIHSSIHSKPMWMSDCCCLCEWYECTDQCGYF